MKERAMSLTRDDIKKLVKTANANLEQIKGFAAHVQTILEVIEDDELPAGTNAEDVGRPPGPEPTQGG